jgi:hypothetical protein
VAASGSLQHLVTAFPQQMLVLLLHLVKRTTGLLFQS